MTKLLSIRIPVLLVLAVLCGCQTVPVQTMPVLEDEGEVFVYLQPFPRAAEQLRFTLAGLAVLREDGKQFPMPLALDKFTGTDMKRQRLIAAGRLPAGQYSGFLVIVKDAAVKVERGEIALIVPEMQQKRDFLFKVEKKRAQVITLALNYAESRPNDFAFDPKFFIASPSRPLVEILGYAVNTGHNNITIFDKMNLQAVGVIAATGEAPRGMALDQRRKRGYIVLSGDDTIEVLELNDLSVLATIMLLRGDNPQEAALTPDGQTLLVANAGSDTVSIIDTGSLVEVNRISVANATALPDISRTSSGRSPRSLVIDRAGRKAFVFNSLSDNISVIDISSRQTSDWQLIGTIATGPEPVRGQFNRTGDRLYVIHAQYPYLFVIDPASFSVVKRVLIDTGAIFLKVDARTGLIYLGKRNDATVTVYDPFSFSPVDSIPAGGAAGSMAIDNETNNLYLIVPERKVLMVVNLVTRKLVAEIDINERPSWVTVMGEQ